MINQLQDLFACLEKHKVRYLVIGGIASILYGVPRTTFDLDILIDTDIDNIKNMVDAFVEAGMGTALLTTPEKIRDTEITIFQDKVRVDVQTKTPGIEFEISWQKKNIVDLRGHQVYLVSKEDLIASKVAAGRDKDIEDVILLSSK